MPIKLQPRTTLYLEPAFRATIEEVAFNLYEIIFLTPHNRELLWSLVDIRRGSIDAIRAYPPDRGFGSKFLPYIESYLHTKGFTEVSIYPTNVKVIHFLIDNGYKASPDGTYRKTLQR